MVDGIGDRIKLLRNAEKLSQEELAEKLDFNVKSIQRYETNKYRPDTYALIKLATYFDVTTDYLLGLTGAHTLREVKGNDSLPSGIYKRMYEKYILCKRNVLDESKEYFWIHSYTDEAGKAVIGGQTVWSGWFDEQCRKEVRTLREVDPISAIKLCTEVYGRPLIINTEDDVEIYNLFGGNAIIDKEVCGHCLPEYLLPFID